MFLTSELPKRVRPNSQSYLSMPYGIYLNDSTYM